MIITNLAEKKSNNISAPATRQSKIIPKMNDNTERAPRKPYIKESYSHHSCFELCGRQSPCGNKACSNYRGKK